MRRRNHLIAIFVLKTHIKQVHEKGKPFSCNHCDCASFSKNIMDNHIAIVHEKKKSFNCDICGKMFGRNYLVKF